MQQLDVFQTYFDNAGEPLINARVRFCNLDDSIAQVYEYNSGTYVSLGATIYTNSAGKFAKTIFLADHDYRIYFDKQVDDSGETEDENYINIGSTINKYEVFEIEVNSDCIQTIGTIAELRATDPQTINEHGGVKMLTLLGYSIAGDKAPINYVWDSTCTENDDGGAVIQVTINGESIETGRWVLKITSGIIDVRDFGVFPTAAVEPNTSNRYAFSNAVTYAQNNGYTLTAYAGGCYDVSNITILGKLICGEDAVLAVADEYSCTIYNADSSVVFVRNDSSSMNGSATIYGSTLYSHQNGSNTNAVTVYPNQTMVLDTNLNYTLTYGNIKLDVRAEQTYPRVVNNCEIISAGLIDYNANSSFSNCRIKQSYFTSETTVAQICEMCSNCTTFPADWDNRSDYITFVNNQAINKYEYILTAQNLNGTTTNTSSLFVTGSSTFTSTMNVNAALYCGNTITTNGLNVNNTATVGALTCPNGQISSLLGIARGFKLEPFIGAQIPDAMEGLQCINLSQIGDGYQVAGTIVACFANPNISFRNCVIYDNIHSVAIPIFTLLALGEPALMMSTGNGNWTRLSANLH